jgi:hypothetical protein
MSSNQERPWGIILALQVSGWIAIVISILSAGYVGIATMNGQGASIEAWGFVGVGLIGGFILLALAILVDTLSDLSTTAYRLLQDIKPKA